MLKEEMDMHHGITKITRGVFPLVGLLCLATLLMAAPLVVHAAPGVTERVSVATDGTQGNNMSGRRGAPANSADGRFIVFDSLASNLVPGDTNAIDDVFVRDRQTGATERVSVASDGTQGDAQSNGPAISADGRFVAFTSTASNLVPGDTNGVADTFVHDRQTGATERVSVGKNKTQANAASGSTLGPSVAISADGRFVAFTSTASNLVSGDTNGTTDVFVRDRQTGATERVSVGKNKTQANASSSAPSISADGRFIAFASGASNLVPGDTNGATDVFVRDRLAGTTERVSISSTGEQNNDPAAFSTSPDISADGRFVVFASTAVNLVEGDTNGVRDVFVRDRLAGITERVSVASGGTQGDWPSPSDGIRGGPNFGPAISADGRLVVFDSSATNLVPGDTNTCEQQGAYVYSTPGTCPDVFVHDRQTGTTERVSVDSAGAQANDASTDPAISGDGTLITFFSAASNLVPNDTNSCVFPAVAFFNGHCPDIFVHVGG
jgi:Tol biopolymer transport system component